MPLELPDGWRDQLPDDIKADGALDTLTTIDQMAAMVVNARKYATNSIRIPGVDVTPEARTEFMTDLQKKVPDLVYVGEGADLSGLYDRMGRPKEATGYALGDIPEPLQGNFENLTKKAYELGLSSGQLKGLSETMLTDFQSSMDIQTGKMEESKNALKAEYGDAMESKLKAASEFSKMIGFDADFSIGIKDGIMGLENMKAFEKVMSGFQSTGPRIGPEAGYGGTTALTPLEAEAQITEMQNNKDHPYNNPSSSLHIEAKKKFVELVTAAEAGKTPTEDDKFRAALGH